MNDGYWKYLRRLAKGADDAVLSAHIPASWWHPQGVRKMVKRLEGKGFPWLRGWLFFTLTIDQKKFASPQKAYDAGKVRVRRVIFLLRRAGFNIRRYAFKLELQRNGWPHWHLIVDCRDFIDHDVLTDLWGYGTADVRRIKPNKWRYLLKYVVKGGEQVPEWVLNYPKRIRVFQTSVGFFSKPGVSALPEQAEAEEEEREPQPQETLGEKFERWSRTAHLRFRSSIQHVQKVTLVARFLDIILDHVEQGGRVIDYFNLPLTTERVLECVQPA